MITKMCFVVIQYRGHGKLRSCLNWCPPKLSLVEHYVRESEIHF